MYQIVNCYQENTQKILDFKLESRYLWEDHISYTRNAIISGLASLSDLSAVSDRLIQNQIDIGAFVSPFYTDEQTNTLVELLKQHIIIAAKVIAGEDGSIELWRVNGDEIVNQMYQMNSKFWPTTATNPLWTKHLDMTIAQITARKNNLWDDDISAYDSNHMCVSEFADIFSNGIIYQNMEMFCL